VFLLNAVTYGFIIVAVMGVTLPRTTSGSRPRSVRELLSGLAVVRDDKAVRTCLVTISVFSLLCLPFVSHLPVLASENLGIDPESTAYGWLYATFGLGAVAGALSIGSSFAAERIDHLNRVGLVGFAVALSAFALLRDPEPAFPVAFMVGFCYFATITSLSTVLQHRLDDAVRGRVMALWIMGFGGTVPIGAILAGPLIDATSITAVVLFGVAVALGLAAYSDLRGADTPTPVTSA
jgi:predicted MFS family arabinose efflux permease